MITEFVVPVIRTVCPKGMNEQNCPVRNYLKSDKTKFNISANESYLMPNTDDAKILGEAFIEMKKLCAQCQNANNQNVK